MQNTTARAEIPIMTALCGGYDQIPTILAMRAFIMSNEHAIKAMGWHGLMELHDAPQISLLAEIAQAPGMSYCCA